MFMRIISGAIPYSAISEVLAAKAENAAAAEKKKKVGKRKVVVVRGKK